MAQKVAVRNHAIYLPPRPLPRPAVRRLRPHATPAKPYTARLYPPIRRRTQSNGIRSTGASFSIAHLIPVTAPVGIAIFIVGCTYVLGRILLAATSGLQHTLSSRAETTAYPLLVLGVFAILMRGQVRVDRYRRLRSLAGLTGKRRGNHALALLCVIVLLFVVGLAAALIAWCAAQLVGFLTA